MKTLRKIIRYTVLLCVLVSIPILYQRWAVINTLYLEKDAPKIEIVSKPEGVGVDPEPLVFKISDSGSGLDEVVVKVQQREWKKELTKERLGGKPFDFLTEDGPLPRVKEKTLSVRLPVKEDGLRAGKLNLNILTFDRSVWSNRSEINLELEVDFSRPKIEAITPNQNAYLGGCELVFYTIKSKQAQFKGVSGVQRETQLFEGFSASLIDSAFAKEKNLYVSLFPVPLDFNKDTEKFRLYAQDVVGNSTNANFNYSVQHTSFGKRIVSSEDDICESAQFKSMLEIRDTVEEKDLRALLAKIQKSDTPRLFTGVFKQFPARQIGFYGEQRVIQFEKKPRCSQQTWHTEYAFPEGSVVNSPNTGKVSFIGNLGTRGLAIILDHGLGLTSIYYHLDKAETKVGDIIEQGQKLGIAGSSGVILTGLKESARLGFEIRLHGLLVRPAEWWDANWQREHVDKEIRFVKKGYGLLTEQEILMEKKRKK